MKASEESVAGVFGIEEIDQKFEPSVVNESTDESKEILPPASLFENIMEKLSDFTKEKPEVVLSNKLAILRVLKAHHPVKLHDYQYGLTVNLRKNQRLIVFEWNDRKRVREYSKDLDNKWKCLECYRLSQHVNKYIHSHLYFINGIAFALIDHACYPRDFELIMQYQRFLEEGDTTKARAMSRRVGFTFEQNSLA